MTFGLIPKGEKPDVGKAFEAGDKCTQMRSLEGACLAQETANVQGRAEGAHRAWTRGWQFGAILGDL